MFGNAIRWRSRNPTTFFLLTARSPGIMSSRETPTTDTRDPNVAPIARRSAISSTHGTHHVAQTFITRTDAAGENAAAIAVGSRTSTSCAAPAAVALRKIAANCTNSRIGSVHFHFNGAVPLVVLHALAVVREKVLGSEVLFELGVCLGQALDVLDEVDDATGLVRQRFHLCGPDEITDAQSNADEVERHARRSCVGEHLVV